MVVVSWVDIWVVADSWSSDWVSSSWMMMVPPPWFISWVMRSWVGDWTSGDCIGGNVGVCIGRNVMVVVFRWVDIRCWAVLSISFWEMDVAVDWVVVMCLVLWQAGIRRAIAMMAKRVCGCACSMALQGV